MFDFLYRYVKFKKKVIEKFYINCDQDYSCFDFVRLKKRLQVRSEPVSTGYSRFIS